MKLTKEFLVPALVAAGIPVYLLLEYLKLNSLSIPIAIIFTLTGSFDLFKDTAISLKKRRFALDYIAIVAIIVGLITREYLVTLILALMVSGGTALESYGVSQAKRSLTKLITRIPEKVSVQKNKRLETMSVSKINVGEVILVRKGEVIPLDGILESLKGETDESSLTGEPYFIEKSKGDIVRSGTINIGEPMTVKVTRVEKDSTYRKIIEMVQRAQEEKPPMIRLADKYSVFFTIITFTIAAVAYAISNFDLERVLAVLAIATPCPLIIATPIALLGGMNASAKKKIIVKKLSSLEVLAQTKAIVFDKTGTITMGNPTLTEVEIKDKSQQESKILSIAEAIERNSLHPLAKAIVLYAHTRKAPTKTAQNIQEEIGRGISADIEGEKYTLSKMENQQGMVIGLFKDKKEIARLHFEETIKKESKKTIVDLKKLGLEIYIFTGDKLEAAKKVVSELGEGITIKAQMTPKDKQDGIRNLKNDGTMTAMVGDGINDAPALALADVGISFTNGEQTAASEAADIVLLGGNFSMVLESWAIAKRSISIATQSITWGIGLSILGMILATTGLIKPIGSALVQEAIDVMVILNALRASK